MTADLIEKMDKLCAKHKGKHRLQMVVEDPDERVRIALHAKARKVNANELVGELVKLGVKCRLN